MGEGEGEMDYLLGSDETKEGFGRQHSQVRHGAERASCVKSGRKGYDV